MGFQQIAVLLFLQLQLWFASGPSRRSLGRFFLQILVSQIFDCSIVLSLQNTVNDLFSGPIFIGGVVDVSVDGCINGGSDSPTQSLEFAFISI